AQDALARLAAPLAAEVRTERAVDALVEVAATADLLVVGARGVTGIASLGSVSERVAHRAESSVLVVRRGG
ncbi:MAG TPA: universal stress protein, partial [Miltoncostaeaceae bacterium]|nr:universal stress protein [Miltoncostaeaceae bacterium]